MMFNMKEAAQSTGATLRSSFIGFFVGVLPGAGATIASAIAYMTEKKSAAATSLVRAIFVVLLRRKPPTTLRRADRLFRC